MDDKPSNLLTLVPKNQSIASSANEPVPDIIEKLEILLSQAKTGEVQAIAIAIWDNNQSARSTFFLGAYCFPLLGALDWLKLRIENLLRDAE